MYAYYLKTSGALHPDRELILKALPQSFDEVLDQYLLCPVDKPIYFIKGMAHHYCDLPLDFLEEFENVFLIRDPVQLIASFSKVIPYPTMRDIGLKKEWEIFDYLQKRNCRSIVLDSGELLTDPPGVLQQLCAQLEISFDERMLSWTPGPRKDDGVWAEHWYGSVHKSCGFIRQDKKSVTLQKRHQPLLEEAMPYYQSLFQYAIKAELNNHVTEF